MKRNFQFKIFNFAIIEEWAWYVFLATLAWQTRLILWQADLQFIEWRSMALYVSDVLMLGLFALAIVQGWGRHAIFRKSDWLLLLLVGAAALSLRSALTLEVGVYQLIRLAQFIAFFIYLRSWALRRFNPDASAVAFVAGALVQATLALAQYVLQHDVGIRWLGETLLQTDMRGVAVFYDLAHVKVLRAYGTLPHPNILAAYLMLGFWALLWLYRRHVPQHATRSAQHVILLWAICGAVMVLAMEMTFSRTMLATWILATGAMFVIGWRTRDKVLRLTLRDALILIVIVSAAFATLQWQRLAARAMISSGEEAVQLRIRYNSDALHSGSGFLSWINWTGVGIGNFSTWVGKNDPTLPVHLRQPAHNVFLLVYSELGIIGLGLWVTWLAWLARDFWKRRRKWDMTRVGIVLAVGAFLFIALFDHFFWTLQQGRALWWLLFALMAFLSAAPLPSTSR